MIEHYKAALAGFANRTVTIKKYISATYDPETGTYSSSETIYDGIACRISKYTERDIANGGGLIKLQDKKFIFLADVFPTSMGDNIKIVFDSKIYEAVRITMDMTESIIFVQGRT